VLKSIFIKNFVIIPEVSLDISNGLTSITGETGSGKSLILGAINFCISGSANSSIVMQGADSANVTLTFDNIEKIAEILGENGIEINDDEIFLSRQISKDGKKRCFINNQPISQKLLDSFLDDLITIYAQHSLSQLFKPSSHIKFLDEFLQEKELLNSVSQLYKEMKLLEKELEKHKEDYERNAREYEYLQNMATEISSLKIKENEEEELADKRIHLQSIAKKTKLIAEISENFTQSGIISSLSSISRQLIRSGDNQIFEKIIADIDSALNHLSNVESQLEELQNSEYSEQNLEEIEERLFAIRAIARKYNCHPSDLKKLLSNTEEQLSSFHNSADIIKSYEKQIKQKADKFLSDAKKLSDRRHLAAKILMEKVSQELIFLDMPNCDFLVEISKLDEKSYNERGIDSVIYKASTNPGTPHSAIDKIASGGEMARFMLALQVVLLESSAQTPTIIFDEIDTGIGGKVADSVGNRLKKLSEFAKVIVVTHQPQVASKSDTNILVIKKIINDKTQSCAKIISEQEKINEIARMLSGKIITIEAINAAKQLIGS
jgi:DNA repair protein RecN (Recombination protein N)